MHRDNFQRERKKSARLKAQEGNLGENKNKTKRKKGKKKSDSCEGHRAFILKLIF